MKVKMYCKCCAIEKKDYNSKIGRAYPFQINDNAFYVQIYFDVCGHKSTHIWTKQQLEKVEVKDG